MRVLVTGSRHWRDKTTIVRAFDELGVDAHARVTVLHGAAKGADQLAAWIATQRGWQIECHPADWDAFGARAGSIRNEQMLAAGADIVLAFPLPSSIGTRHMIRLATLAHVPLRIYAPSEGE